MKLVYQSLLYRNANFRYLYIGQFVSFIGTMMTGVVLPYQIYHLTHSTLMVGLLGLFQLIPLIFTALVGGVVADRYHRRLLLLLTEFFLALGCLVLAWNASLATPSLVMIFLTATLLSAINGFHRPALESLTQQMVKKSDYPSMGSLRSFQGSIGMIAGPALGGVLLANIGVAQTYLVDFFTFLISLFALLKIQGIPKPLRPKEDLSTWASLKEGCSFALSRQVLMGSYTVDFVAMIFGMPNALFPAIAESFGGAAALGMLYSAPAVGALLVSFWSGWSRRFRRHGAAIAYSAALWGLAIIGFGFSSTLTLALIFLGFAGAFDALSGIFRTVLWSETIPNEYRGRLAGIEMISYLSGPRLGDTEAGLLASLFGVTFAVVSGGVLCIASVALCGYFLPKFWRYRAPE